MKVLGIVTETARLRYIVLSGSISSPCRESEKLLSMPYPADMESGAGLNGMLKTLTGLFTSIQPGKIVVLQSVPPRMGKPSATRPVVEALIKMASQSANQECVIVHPNTLRAKEKKFVSCVGSDPENAFNGGQNFSPAVSKDTHLIAWVGLEQ